ncbi:hypothetical protein AB5N19_13743 [Seiridium cardinale]
MLRSKKQTISDAGVIIGLVAVIVILLWAHFASPTIAVGSLSLIKSTLLKVGVTVAATLFMLIVSSSIQQALIRTLEDRLRGLGRDRTTGVDPLIGNDDNDQDTLERLNQEWRAILRIDTFVEKLHNYRVFFTFLMCTLITTSIVVSLTPTLTTKPVPYTPMIPDTSIGQFSTANNRSCVGVCENCDVTQGLPTAYMWAKDQEFAAGGALDRANVTVYYAAYDADCPQTRMIQLASGINTDNPDDHVYAQSGVAVERTAMGAPASLYEGGALLNLSAQYGQALVRTTQCVPVMTSNPVRCRTGGQTKIETATVLSVQGVNITAFGLIWLRGLEQSKFYLRYGSRNLTTDSTMANYLRPMSNDTLNDVGKAYITFGAVTDPKGQTPFASYLAGIVGDPDKEAGVAGGSSYTVSCVVDPRNVFEYRSVTLNLHALGDNKASNMAQYLSGAGPCTPVNPTIGDKLFATAGTAAHYLVNENRGMDGYFATIARLAGYGRNSSFAFPDSSNYLEDVLGVVSALAVSKMQMGNGTLATAVNDQSTAYVDVTRLGTDSGWILWLLLPPVASLLALTYLGLWRQSEPGGAGFNGKEDERPKQYTAESLHELIGLGWSAGRNSQGLEPSDVESNYDFPQAPEQGMRR